MDKASSQGWVADVFEGCDTVVAVNNAELAVWQFLHHHRYRLEKEAGSAKCEMATEAGDTAARACRV